MTHTAFATAERASHDVIEQQRQQLISAFNSLPLFDSLPDPFVIVNEFRQIVFANAAMVDLFGQPGETLDGCRPGEAIGCEHAVEGCGTTRFCETCGAVQTILSGLEGRRMVSECRVVRHDGLALDLRVSGSPLVINDKRYVSFAIRDISHEKRRLILERIFFHDVLNMVAAVTGYAGFLKRIALPEEAIKAVQVIQDVGQQIGRSIHDYHDLSAAESGELEIDWEKVNSLDLLRFIQTIYSGLEVAEGRIVRIAETSRPAEFMSNTELLVRVVGNMVKNALEASAEGDTVTISCGLTGERVWFEVHNPASMPDQVQLQVFQRSFSTKGPGRGVGTYSMKLLTEHYMKGTIRFSSSPEHGTTFRATYPLKP